MNATELVAYDQAKQTLLGPTVGMRDGIGAHILSGLSAGLAATLLGSPVDVVKTRVMNAAKVNTHSHCHAAQRSTARRPPALTARPASPCLCAPSLCLRSAPARR